MHYIMVIMVATLLAFDFALSKKYQSSEGTAMPAGLKFNMLSGLFTAVIFFALSGFKIEFSWFSVLMAFGMSLCAISYSIIGFRILKAGGMALYSIFLILGGVLLPYLFGVLFLEEPLTSLRVVGVLLIGVRELPATVLYPIVTSGSILFSALAGSVFYKEKLSTYQLLSIALCFVGTLLFL